MERLPLSLAVLAVVTVGAFLLGIRQGANNDFPTQQLRELKLGADRIRDPHAMYIGDSAKLAAYDEGLDGEADVVILGDSLVARGRWDELFPDIAIHQRGLGGDTVTGVASRMHQVRSKRPRAVVLMIGVNDIMAGNRIEDIAHVYDEIVTVLARDTRVIATSILPCCNESDARKIAMLNKAIERISEQRGARYLDLASVVAPKGRIAHAYTIDGVHLTAAGYKRWRDALAPYIEHALAGRCVAPQLDFPATSPSTTSC